MSDRFPQYTTDYISGVMSLRKPQTASLKILEDILESVSLRKGMNLRGALGAVHAMYPICTDFERDFMSLTFALATGVGKTRLMGAFIAYLYTQRNVRNFFVVAPNTTIYEKLKRDLSDYNSPKYVFRGLGCFSRAPQIITDDDYKSKQISSFESDIQETIAKNRSGERKGKVIMPERKMYAYQESSKVRVAAYCRVSTAEEAQAGSFEMQIQHFKSVIENNPAYELVKIYTDEGVSGTSVDRRKGFQEMMTDAEKPNGWGRIDGPFQRCGLSKCTRCIRRVHCINH